MKSHYFLAGLFVAGVALANLSYANHENGKPHADGHAAHFQAADTNKDGKLSFDEFKAGHDKRMQEHFKQMDANQDGFVDEAEKKAARDQRHKSHQDMKDKCEHKAGSFTDKP